MVVPRELQDVLQKAEKIRDKIVHGKDTTALENRTVLAAVLAYAEGLDEFVFKRAEFRPFTVDMRGFTGRREALDDSTTRWLMRGLGFGSGSGSNVGE